MTNAAFPEAQPCADPRCPDGWAGDYGIGKVPHEHAQPAPSPAATPRVRRTEQTSGVVWYVGPYGYSSEREYGEGLEAAYQLGKAEGVEAIVARIEETLTSDRLRTLADWFDKDDLLKDRNFNDEVQSDLRAAAAVLDLARLRVSEGQQT